jgi:hypothetical protein
VFLETARAPRGAAARRESALRSYYTTTITNQSFESKLRLVSPPFHMA